MANPRIEIEIVTRGDPSGAADVGASLDAVSTSAEGMETAAEDAAEALDTMVDATADAGEAAQETSEAVDAAAEANEALAKTSEDAAEATEGQGKAMEDLDRVADDVSSRVARLKEEIEQTTQSMEDASEGARGVETDLGKIGREVSKLGGPLRTVGQLFRSMKAGWATAAIAATGIIVREWTRIREEAAKLREDLQETRNEIGLSQRAWEQYLDSLAERADAGRDLAAGLREASSAIADAASVYDTHSDRLERMATAEDDLARAILARRVAEGEITEEEAAGEAMEIQIAAIRRRYEAEIEAAALALEDAEKKIAAAEEAKAEAEAEAAEMQARAEEARDRTTRVGERARRFGDAGAMMQDAVTPDAARAALVQLDPADLEAAFRSAVSAVMDDSEGGVVAREREEAIAGGVAGMADFIARFNPVARQLTSDLQAEADRARERLDAMVADTAALHAAAENHTASAEVERELTDARAALAAATRRQ
jgi:chromosome segregation ATPase